MSVYISFSDDCGWNRIAATIREGGIPPNATTQRAVPEDATGCARAGLAGKQKIREFVRIVEWVSKIDLEAV